MRRTIPVVVTAVVVAAVVVGAIGVDLASGQGDIHVVTVAAEGRWQTLDFNDDGIGLGDRNVKREPLFAPDGTTRVGKADWDCVIMGKDRPFCTAVVALEGGEIVIEGLLPEAREEAPFAVVGGAGTYANAQGDGTWTNHRRKDDFVIDLIPPV